MLSVQAPPELEPIHFQQNPGLFSLHDLFYTFLQEGTKIYLF
jgi:hypothetical protein